MALKICIVIMFLVCIVTGMGWSATKGNLQAENEQYASSLGDANWLTGIANGQVLLTNQQIELANVTIGKLRLELADSEEYVAYLQEKAQLEEFESLGVLKAWLEEDDTDSTLYIFGAGCLTNYDCDDYATALVYNALLDGYSVSTQIEGNHMLNSTIIGDKIYFIEPQDDEVWLWGYRD